MTKEYLLEGKRVLIVDDEPDVLEAFVDLLPNYNRLVPEFCTNCLLRLEALCL